MDKNFIQLMCNKENITEMAICDLTNSARYRDSCLLEFEAQIEKMRLACTELHQLRTCYREMLRTITDPGQEGFMVFSRLLAQAREEERNCIGRELHDDVAQSLCLAELLLQKACSSADAGLKPQLDQLWEVLQEASSEIKELSWRLRPSTLCNMGLQAALELLITRYTSRTGVNVDLTCEGLETPLPRETIIYAYWILHEALSNVARHAKVTDVSVKLAVSAGVLHIKVRDCGCGFDPSKANDSTGGLASMKERALLEGGRLNVNSAPGCGTTVTAELPFSGEDLDIDRNESRYATSQDQLPLF